MNPLCTLRYSATHVDKHHMVYRLDAVDAYERKLVKQIEVASATVEGGAQQAVRAAGVGRATASGAITARRSSWTCRRRPGSGASEVAVSGRRRPGADHQAGHLRRLSRSAKSAPPRASSSSSCELPGGEQYLSPAKRRRRGRADAVQREMIRRTIQEHLDKEKRLRPQGIKVLSACSSSMRWSKYRKYDADGNCREGRVRAHL